MNITALLLSLALIALLIYASHDLWFKPERYVEKSRRKRLELYKSWASFTPIRNFLEYFDKHPKFEIWYSRSFVLILLLIYILGLLLALTNGL